VAALLHLFFMAAFSWMLVEGLLLWSKVVAPNHDCLPVLIVTITLASASGKYSADGYCWLSVQNGVIWGFAGPVIFIIMVRKLNPHHTMAAVKAVLVLLPILGLTWVCGVLVPFSIVMAYIFILLNSLQVHMKVDLCCLFDYFCFMYSEVSIIFVVCGLSALIFCF
uniref:G-protein coupled receptors family 2 profile 2 domain-containing protein n=1 Tax=Sander lucioperca TaxID=283035 RepID=A0A8D0DIB0_SANLU